MLNSDQENALNLLDKWFKVNDGTMFVLEGFAGTGKTFLIKHFIETLNGGTLVKLTAPTHKAVSILKKSCEDLDKRSQSNVSFSTIHSYLNLKEKIDYKTGEVSYVADFNGDGKADNSKLIIVDEVSMLSKPLYNELFKLRFTKKILFMGDSAQIPPIGERDSIPLLDKKSLYFNRARLDKIERQADGNPLLEVSFKIRENLFSQDPYGLPVSSLNSDNQGVDYFRAGDSNQMTLFKRKMIKAFTHEKYEKDNDFCKVIGYTNRCVAAFNKVIREYLLGPHSTNHKILGGDRIILRTAIIVDRKVKYANNTEMLVMGYSVRKNFSVPGVTLFFYRCYVLVKKEDGKYKHDSIDVLHESSQEQFEKYAKTLYFKALKKKTPSVWSDYYGFKKQFAEIDYNYAITAHRSQGSTYKYVFLIESDIKQNKKLEERNRILYTSYSRASKKVNVLL